MPPHSRMLGRNDKEANVKQSFAKERESGLLLLRSLYSKWMFRLHGKPQRICTSGGPSAYESLDASITASIAGDDIVVTVVLANRATEAFPLLRWNLPADGRLTGSLFEVNRNGESQRTLGRW